METDHRQRQSDHQTPSQVNPQDITRLIAFYLPQFHPIPENDAWWGRGFTEWSNTSTVQPRFRGHYQPHLPADLGFYDLRLPEVRAAQADLARQYGIYGFCYYHYWFHGRRLLERPFSEVLATGQPDFPFCLCWANESWNRAWDGSDSEPLIQQTYSAADDLSHIRSLIPAFLDRRYVRVNGRPLYLVWRASQLPDPITTTDRWRNEAAKAGLELLLCRVESHDRGGDPPGDIGFDLSLRFHPGGSLMEKLIRKNETSLRARLRAYFPDNNSDIVYDYAGYAQMAMAEPRSGYPLLESVFPSWDNSARRRRRARIFVNSTPELYQVWLRETIKRSTTFADGSRLAFIVAWNEWAEGNHLEPCQRWGHSYLRATRQALMETAKL